MLPHRSPVPVRVLTTCALVTAIHMLLLVTAQEYPACSQDFYCGGNVASTAVAGIAPNCLCTCQFNFNGTWCQRCQFGFETEATRCNRCLPGFGTFPNCVDQCTNATSSCNGHGNLTGCTCGCFQGYNGTRCDRCATGYSGYPNCVIDCTSSDVSCNGKALSVTGSPPDCVCHCARGYTGAHCEMCDYDFTGPWPSCTDTCTNPATSCNGKGTGFSRRNPPNDCVCTCATGYAGDRCELCAAGYSGYPNCRDNCTLGSVSCNGQGEPIFSVEPVFAPNCICRCYAPTVFNGTTCEKCSKYRQNPPLCNDCAAGYDQYPFCFDACTVPSVSCRGEAKTVWKENGACKCECMKGYTGTLCEICDEGFDRDPTNATKCNNRCDNKLITCNNHADQLYKNTSNGVCVCKCARGYGGSDCGTCAYGFGTNYPDCRDNCTNPDASCTDVGRATGVYANPYGAGCMCNCTARFQGTLCNLCSLGYTLGSSCEDDCTNPMISCSGHGAMYGQTGNCRCECSQGFAGTKCERCAVGFEGDQCQYCASGFSGWPYCTDDCTNATTSCSGNAKTPNSVGGERGNCKCDCKDGWAGNRCDECHVGYEGTLCSTCSVGYGTYPKCIDLCINNGVSCNNHGRVVGGVNGNCTCACDLGWDGQRCTRCAAGYQGELCQVCAAGYYLYGSQCIDQCILNSVSCNGNALDTPDGILNAGGLCVCKCKPNYDGAKCDRCKIGYEDYAGGCHDACTAPSISCSNNATAVSGKFPNCVCTCPRPYSGTRCTECDLGFTGATCSACAAGFFSHPIWTCKDNCTSVNISCYSRATKVSEGLSPDDACVCTCMTGFTGSRCEKCAKNYAGWPDCVPACTADFCSNRATYVAGTYPACTCICQAQFDGTQCEKCKKNFAGTTCGSCAPGYKNYPTCSDACTLPEVSCFGPATSVRADADNPDFCVCTCKTGFAGATCSGCTAGYDDFPFCTDTCRNVEVSCNGTRALSVSGTSPFCECQCKAQFGGYRCDSCAYGFTGTDCQQCAVGFEPPSCIDNCTSVAISCNNRAFSVSPGPTGCKCDCIRRFNGSARCDKCARGFTGAQCDECLPGFDSYPDCVETCSVPSTSCNGHGLSVSGSYPDCRCVCKHGWAGVRCDVCAAGFTGSACAECASGYKNRPNCTDACTNVVVSCNNRAYGVTTDTDGTCRCDCFGEFALPTCATCYRGYTGALCDSCAPGYRNTRSSGKPECVDDCSNATVSCNGIGRNVSTLPSGDCHCSICPYNFAGHRCEGCAAGYSNYPLCVEDCTDVGASCMGRAVAVNGSLPNCNCLCKPAFTGARCQNCAKGYNGTDCSSCSDGFVRSGSLCIDNCTVPSITCNGQGSRVRRTDVAGVCECVCHQNYTGGTCNRCNSGYMGYPTCSDACLVDAVSCSGVGSIRVFSTATNCTCACPPNYAGTRCERCASGYTGAGCVEDCTSTAVSCNGHASRVAGTAAPCACTCTKQYEGLTCNTCATGFSPYPQCFDECKFAISSCNNNAYNVTPSADGCLCNCFPGFAPPTCGSCATGYAGYPNCTDNCTDVAVSCSGHALAVKKLPSGTTCNCTCAWGWNGTRCDRCAQGFTGTNCDECTAGYVTVSAPCDACAMGYTGYPRCRDGCSVTSVSCSAAGTMWVEPSNVVGSTACICRCVRGFTGSKCERCAIGFEANGTQCVDRCLSTVSSCNSLATAVRNTTTAGLCECDCFSNAAGAYCQTCATGYAQFPLCVDNCSVTAVSCGPYAVAVRAGSGSCNCTCAVGYTGAKCDQCAAGYGGYTDCTDQCTHKSVSCAGADYATAVTRVSSANGTHCECSCLRGYDTAKGCGACAAGFADFPFCYEDCTNTNVSCNGNALSVRGSPQNCVCSCKPEFLGDRCDVCSAGRVNYPLCEDNCTLTSVSCSSAATGVRRKTAAEMGNATNASKCRCACVEGYGGDHCETCSAGYTGYPWCVPACSSVEVSCSGNADSVNGTYPECVCQCKIGFAGARCNRCAAGYAGYPNCVDNCTIASVTCPPGIALRTQYWPSCQCDCAANFTGVRCELCARGYANPPLCYDACTNVSVSCRGNATAVQTEEPALRWTSNVRASVRAIVGTRAFGAKRVPRVTGTSPVHRHVQRPGRELPRPCAVGVKRERQVPVPVRHGVRRHAVRALRPRIRRLAALRRGLHRRCHDLRPRPRAVRVENGSSRRAGPLRQEVLSVQLPNAVRRPQLQSLRQRILQLPAVPRRLHQHHR
jgi:hypothetical protein